MFRERYGHKHTLTDAHWQTQVSVQVIERDRRAPECHTWALGGQRRTEVGSTQPFTTQAFTMEINHQPGLAIPCQGLPTHSLLCVQSADCAAWKPCSCALSVCVAVLVSEYACAPVSINPPVCAFALYACTCSCPVDRTAGSRRRSAIVNRNTDLHVCL